MSEIICASVHVVEASPSREIEYVGKNVERSDTRQSTEFHPLLEKEVTCAIFNSIVFPSPIVELLVEIFVLDQTQGTVGPCLCCNDIRSLGSLEVGISARGLGVLH